MRIPSSRWWPLYVIIVLLCLALILNHPQLEQMTLIVLVFVTAMYAIFTYHQAEATRTMAQEMKIERQSRITPSIFIYFDNPVSNLIELVIKNTGQAAARNVKLSINPPLMDFKNRDISELSLFKVGIDFFAPGREFRQVIDTGVEFFKDGSTQPLTYEVTMSYSDIEGKQIYTQVMPLELSVWRHLKTHRESDIDLLKKEVARIADALESLQKNQTD